ncbi:MAG: AAA family ATPase [Acidobacteriota bacterium]
MYEEFYGLRESPFNLTPDPRFIFYSHRHREAFDHLFYGITQRKGFIQLTGEVGAGKTTLCRALLERLGEEFETALVLNPTMTSIQLLRSVLQELGLEARGNDRIKLMTRLNQHLLEQVAEGRDVVLIIDEAQDLSDTLLEQVRLLSNLETDQRKLLQIVLMGQPELRSKLEQYRLRQLRQRITVRYHLDALTRHETEFYLQHRLQIAGSSGRPTFSPWAIRSIHRYAGGVPRLINAVADKALLCGYVESRDHLGFWQIRRAIRELEGVAS